MSQNERSSTALSVPPPLTRNETERFRRLVRESSERAAAGEFVIEGPHLVERALEEAPELVKQIVMTEESEYDNHHITRAISKKPIARSRVSLVQASRISDTKTSQGVFALVAMPVVSRETIIDNLTLALDGVQDPGNVGTIIRSAAWFGVGTIILGASTADPYSPKAIRATQGEIFSVRCLRTDDLAAELNARKNAGQKILATTTSADACSLYKERFEGSCVIVLGSEAHGTSPQIRRLADEEIVIPRIGKGESLNVAMSAAIILSEYTARKQKG